MTRGQGQPKKKNEVQGFQAITEKIKEKSSKMTPEENGLDKPLLGDRGGGWKRRGISWDLSKGEVRNEKFKRYFVPKMVQVTAKLEKREQGSPHWLQRQSPGGLFLLSIHLGGRTYIGSGEKFEYHGFARGNHERALPP